MLAASPRPPCRPAACGALARSVVRRPRCGALAGSTAHGCAASRSLEPALGLFLQSVALVVQNLNILFLPTIQGHAHFPGPRKHLRVLDRDLIGDVVGAGARVALDHVQGVAMEIAGP